MAVNSIQRQQSTSSPDIPPLVSLPAPAALEVPETQSSKALSPQEATCAVLLNKQSIPQLNNSESKSVPVHQWKVQDFLLNLFFIAMSRLFRTSHFLGSMSLQFSLISAPRYVAAKKSITCAAVRKTTGALVIIEIVKTSGLIDEHRHVGQTINVAAFLPSRKRVLELFVGRKYVAVVYAACLQMTDLQDDLQQPSSVDEQDLSTPSSPLATKVADAESVVGSAVANSLLQRKGPTEFPFPELQSFEVKKFKKLNSEVESTITMSAMQKHKEMAVTKWMPIGACILVSVSGLNNLQIADYMWPHFQYHMHAEMDFIALKQAAPVLSCSFSQKKMSLPIIIKISKSEDLKKEDIDIAKLPAGEIKGPCCLVPETDRVIYKSHESGQSSSTEAVVEMASNFQTIIPVDDDKSDVPGMVAYDGSSISIGNIPTYRLESMNSSPPPRKGYVSKPGYLEISKDEKYTTPPRRPSLAKPFTIERGSNYTQYDEPLSSKFQSILDIFNSKNSGTSKTNSMNAIVDLLRGANLKELMESLFNEAIHKPSSKSVFYAQICNLIIKKNIFCKDIMGKIFIEFDAEHLHVIRNLDDLRTRYPFIAICENLSLISQASLAVIGNLFQEQNQGDIYSAAIPQKDTVAVPGRKYRQQHSTAPWSNPSLIQTAKSSEQELGGKDLTKNILGKGDASKRRKVDGRGMPSRSHVKTLPSKSVTKSEGSISSIPFPENKCHTRKRANNPVYGSKFNSFPQIAPAAESHSQRNSAKKQTRNKSTRRR